MAAAQTSKNLKDAEIFTVVLDKFGVRWFKLQGDSWSSETFEIRKSSYVAGRRPRLVPLNQGLSSSLSHKKGF